MSHPSATLCAALNLAGATAWSVSSQRDTRRSASRPPIANLLSAVVVAVAVAITIAILGRRPDVLVVRLNGADLEPIGAAYRLEPFLEVLIASGGPVAVVAREVYRDERRPLNLC